LLVLVQLNGIAGQSHYMN